MSAARLEEGLERELELAERLARRARRSPGELDDVRALGATEGLGVAETRRLFLEHFQRTAEDDLVRARLEFALRQLDREDASDRELALEAGFASTADFRAAFVAHLGLTPAARRALGRTDGFRVALPEGFRGRDVFGLFGRDADGRTERIEGDRLTKALLLEGQPARIELRFAPGAVHVRVRSRRAPGVRMLRAAHARVARMLALAEDPRPFERRMARDPRLRRLIAGRRGTRVPQAVDAYEALVWVIVGQQVNLAFAGTCRSRLIGLCGRDAGDGFVAHPTPEDVARLDYADLTRLQFSRRKAEYLVDASRAIATGELDLARLDEQATARVVRRLGAVRGLGPWSVNYLLLRAIGRQDCVPVGDAGLVVALQRFFDLDARPGPAETLRLMEPFAPWRSLATYHLWKSLESGG